MPQEAHSPNLWSQKTIFAPSLVLQMIGSKPTLTGRRDSGKLYCVKLRKAGESIEVMVWYSALAGSQASSVSTSTASSSMLEPREAVSTSSTKAADFAELLLSGGGRLRNDDGARGLYRLMENVTSTSSS